jgi:hypothetical protein
MQLSSARHGRAGCGVSRGLTLNRELQTPKVIWWLAKRSVSAALFTVKCMWKATWRRKRDAIALGKFRPCAGCLAQLR